MSETKVATGNITPCSFVKQSTTLDGKVTLCGAGDKIYGISQKGTRNPPLSPLDDGYAAIAGENVMLYTFPDTTLLTIGTGGCAPGDRLKADASGFGVATTSTGDEIGAVALGTGASGDQVPVKLISPTQF